MFTVDGKVRMRERTLLKGLSQEMDLAFHECMVSSTVGLNRGRGHLLNFLGAPILTNTNHIGMSSKPNPLMRQDL
jgi:hypothetical protein